MKLDPAYWRNLLRLALVSLLLVILTTPALSDDISDLKARALTPAEVELQRAIEELARGQNAASEAKFKASLRTDPNNIEALLGLAKIEIERNNVGAARSLLQAALKAAPDDANVQTTWGHYLFWQKQYPAAEEAFSRAIQISPDAARPRGELGDLYLLGLHQPKLAIDNYRAALSAEPNNARLHYMLSNALIAANEWDGAQDELENAIRSQPKNPALYQLMGEFLARRRYYDRALQAFATALALKPDFLAPHLSRGELFAETGKPDQAIAEYKAVLKIVPRFATAYTNIGLVEEQNANISAAQKAYTTAIELDPTQTIAYNNLAWLAVNRKENLGDALGWAKKAVALAPDSPICNDTLAWVYRARGERDKAIQALRKAAAIGSQQPEIFYHLGVVYTETGQTAKAQEALRKALSMNRQFEGINDARERLQAFTRTGSAR